MQPFYRKSGKAIPRLWLFTDPRVEHAALIAAVAALPRGSGIIFRHYDLPAEERRALFEEVQKVARRNLHMILLAGDPKTAIAWRADGWHGRRQWRPSRPMLHSAPVHDARELAQAKRGKVDLIFISPVYFTRSHADVPLLGPLGFARLAARASVPAIALGGMNKTKYAALIPLGSHGWAAIDALNPQAKSEFEDRT